MAVVARKRKRRTVLYVVTFWKGKQYWEPAGTGDRREAERLDKRRRDEVRAGTYSPPRSGARSTVRRYSEGWIKGRKNRSADNDRYCIDIVLSVAEFAELELDAVRPRHVLALIDSLHGSGRWARKTVANAIGTAKTMFRDAVIGEEIPANPFVIPRGKLSRRPRRERQAYDSAAVHKLLGDGVGMQRRAFAALALCTGMRAGEICGRRWRDWDRNARPLTALTCDSQYDAAPLKGDDDERARPRVIPVHPVLESILSWWWEEGWELVNRRRPTPDDWIVPSSRGVDQGYTKSGATKLWALVCRDAEVTNLSLHSTRHTFITFARRGTGREDIVESITHNASGDMIDRYNHFEWDPRCEVVRAIRFRLPTLEPVSGTIAPIPGGPSNSAPAPGLEPQGEAETGGKRAPLTEGDEVDEPPLTREKLPSGAEYDAGQWPGPVRCRDLIGLAMAAAAMGLA